LSPDVVKRLEEGLHLTTAALRRKIGLDLSREDHKADVVLASKRNISHRKSCVNLVVQLGQLAKPRRHEPSGVEQHDYRLVSLDLVLAGDHPSAPSCCSPRDVAHLVALNVVSQTFELPPLAARRSTSKAGEQVAV